MLTEWSDGFASGRKNIGIFPPAFSMFLQVPLAGWIQILGYCAYCEIGAGYDADINKRTPGDMGWNPPIFSGNAPETKTRRLNAELANGRLAMMAIIGMFFQARVFFSILTASCGGFLKWWYPTTVGFPTKNDHFWVFWGYHHLRKHPCRASSPFEKYVFFFHLTWNLILFQFVLAWNGFFLDNVKHIKKRVLFLEHVEFESWVYKSRYANMNVYHIIYTTSHICN